MNLKDMPLGRKIAFWCSVIWSWGMVSVHVNDPETAHFGGLVLMLAIPGAIIYWAFQYEKPEAGPEDPAAVVAEQAPSQAPSVPVEAPVPVQPASKEAPPEPVRVVKENKTVIVDISEPGKMLPGCINCINRGVCYTSTQDLEDNYSYKCDEYERDDALDVGRVVDVGKVGSGKKRGA